MKEVYVAEAGSPLALALKDNPEAQRQVLELIEAVKTRLIEEVKAKTK
jgi:hypothetical protein